MWDLRKNEAIIKLTDTAAKVSLCHVDTNFGVLKGTNIYRKIFSFAESMEGGDVESTGGYSAVFGLRRRSISCDSVMGFTFRYVTCKNVRRPPEVSRATI